MMEYTEKFCPKLFHFSDLVIHRKCRCRRYSEINTVDQSNYNNYHFSRTDIDLSEDPTHPWLQNIKHQKRKHSPADCTLRADLSLKIPLFLCIIPPSGMKYSLQHLSCYKFQNRRKDSTAEKQRQPLPSQRPQNQVNGKRPKSINCQKRTGNEAPVHRMSFHHGHITAFPNPAEKTIDPEPAQQKIKLNACYL